jgi:hypothetical protein
VSVATTVPLLLLIANVTLPDPSSDAYGVDTVARNSASPKVAGFASGVTVVVVATELTSTSMLFELSLRL